MSDHLTPAKRSWNMSRIRSSNTKPEKIVRSILHNSGYRFRLHRKDLPGKPDIVLKKYNTCLFVHGCFWHHHENCSRANWPKSNKDYWVPKIKKNIERDKLNTAKLEDMGWNVIVVWECMIKDLDFLQDFLHTNIGGIKNE